MWLFWNGGVQANARRGIAFAVEVEWEYLCALPESLSELHCWLPEV